MKKYLIPIGVLSLIAVVLASLALMANQTPVRQPGGVSGHSGKHVKLPVIALPPVTTTTVAPVKMPVVVQTTVPPVKVTVPVTAPPIRTSGQTTIVTPPPTIVQTTTAPTTTIPNGTVIVQMWTTGVHVGSDGMQCTAEVDTECLALTGTVNENILFNVYGNGATVGTFIPKVGVSNGYACMLLLATQPNKIVLSSFDCSGGPILMPLGTDLSYSSGPS